MVKLFLHNRIYQIAHKVNLTQVDVRNIITSYVDLLKEELVSGRKIQIPNIVFITPDVLNDTSVATLACHAKVLSERLSITYYSVFLILDEYIKSIIRDLEEGRVVNIYSLLTLKPLRCKGGTDMTVHANISGTLKDSKENVLSENLNFRTSINKLIKWRISANFRAKGGAIQ